MAFRISRAVGADIVTVRAWPFADQAMGAQHAELSGWTEAISPSGHGSEGLGGPSRIHSCRIADSGSILDARLAGT